MMSEAPTIGKERKIDRQGIRSSPGPTAELAITKAAILAMRSVVSTACQGPRKPAAPRKEGDMKEPGEGSAGAETLASAQWKEVVHD